jgi:hypothetical protein
MDWFNDKAGYLPQALSLKEKLGASEDNLTLFINTEKM